MSAIIELAGVRKTYRSGSVEFEALSIRDGAVYRARPDGSTERLAF